MLALVGCVVLLLAVIAAVTLDAEGSQDVAANVASGSCLFSVFVAWADQDDVDAVGS